MSDSRKIAFVCHPYHRGGVTSWMLNAAIASSFMGRDVYFVTVEPVKPFHSGKDREKMTDLLKWKGRDIRLITAKVNFTFEFGTEDARAVTYRTLIRDNVPQGTPLIASDDMAVWKALAALADVYPMIGVLHGDQDHYYNEAAKYQDQLSIGVCVSNRIKKTAAKRCTKIDAGKLYTIPCGIDMPPFEEQAEHDNIFRLIFIGRLTDYEKRATDLVKIGAALHKKNIAFHLDIVGNSDKAAIEFGQSFRESGIERFVSFHGWQPKEVIQKLLNGSDVLLLTSNSEGMPLVMMEALASGCGFTGTRVSGIEDYENHPLAVSCLSVYTVGDIDDAIRKINKVTSVPVNIRRQAARKLAEAEFSMQVCLDKYMAAIEAIKPDTLPARKIDFSVTQLLYSKAIAIGRYLKVSIRS